MPFKALGLHTVLVQATREMHYTEPTPIQAEAIPAILAGRDLIATAQTGTGKTAAFGLPLLEFLDPADRTVQALILAPTRELCMQISKDIERFATHMKGTRVVSVYGGASIRDQIRDFVIGLPDNLST